jgi:hypothetical protein
MEAMNPNFLASWNNLCMFLTSDYRLFESAAGRDGPEQARLALAKITLWTQTAQARRACLHAAQTFAVMSRRRTSDRTTFHSEMALFASALVLGLYLFASPQVDEPDKVLGEGVGGATFELLDNVDWRTVGLDGFLLSKTDGFPSMASTIGMRGDSSNYAAKEFITNGGSISFGGIVHRGGFNPARRIFLEYVGLLEDVGRWNVQRYCHILRVMSDMVMEPSSYNKNQNL